MPSPYNVRVIYNIKKQMDCSVGLGGGGGGGWRGGGVLVLR